MLKPQPGYTTGAGAASSAFGWAILALEKSAADATAARSAVLIMLMSPESKPRVRIVCRNQAKAIRPGCVWLRPNAVRSGSAIFELQARKPGIEAAARAQRRMRTFLDDPA